MNERIWTADVYRMTAVSMLRNFGPYGSFEMKGEKWKAWCEAFGLVIARAMST